jgi:predicted double-glycine peptidase
MSETDQEPIVINNKLTKSKYETPEVTNYIIENRNKGVTFEDIAKGLRERGFETINPSTVQKLHLKLIAKSVTVHNTAKEVFDNHTDTLNKMYGESLKLMGIYVKKLREIIETLENAEDPDSLEVKGNIIRTIPVAVQVMREIRSSVETQMELQDKITKTSEKEVVWNEGQMLEYVNDYLKVLEQNGQIKILDNNLK